MMARQGDKEFVPLPGRGVRRDRSFAALATNSRLWLTKDYLLSVDNDRFSEDYRRFYYQDIQAITVRRTRRWEAWNAAWIVLAIVSLGLAVWLWDHTSLWGLAVAMCLALVWNLTKGPSCICHLHTSVHTEELPSLGHLKTVAKVMALLSARIRMAQGEMPDGGVQERAEDIALQRATAEGRGPLAGSVEARGEGYNGGAHRLLFLLLLVAGLVNLVFLTNRHIAMTLLNIVLALGLFGAVLASLVRQFQWKMGAGVRWLTWSTLSFLTLFYFAGMMHYLLVTVANSQTANNQWEIMKIYSSLSPVDTPWLALLKIVFIAGALFLGLPGLILAARSSTTERA